MNPTDFSENTTYLRIKKKINLFISSSTLK